MQKLFKSISKVKGYKTPRDAKSLDGFKKLNIFVGKNNSGKSRFLRYLIKNKEFLITEEILQSHKYLTDFYVTASSNYPDIKDKIGFSIKELGDTTAQATQDFPAQINLLKQKLSNILSQNGDSFVGRISAHTIARHVLSAIANSGADQKKEEYMYAYIPILRGLRPLIKNTHDPLQAYLSEDCYGDRTKYDYFQTGLDDKTFIFSGLGLYEEIRNMLLGDRAQRDFIRSFEDFLSQHFFNEKEIVLTPTVGKDVLTISIDGDEKSIHDLGDGIQSIICSTFLAFQNRDKNIVLFIEEPEIYLHPSMQRTLVEVFIKELKNVQLFLTTHSNHFLDLIYDYEDSVAIYSFEKKGVDFYISDISSGREIIDLLGVRNSSVYLANCVLWTEGVSDRIYIKKFLELYAQDNEFPFKEDNHYALAEYGGGNIENFDFIDLEENTNKVNVKSISKKNLVIADNDGNKQRGSDNKKAKRLKKLEKLLGENFYDKYIEIENLIPYKVYRSMLSKLLPSDSLKSIKLKNSSENVEAEFNNSLKTEKIGTLLKKYLIEKKPGKKNDYFNNESIECLGEKKKIIADLIVKEIDSLNISFKDLPIQTKNFVRKMVKFINSHNK